MVEFSVPIAHPKARPRFTRNGIAYTDRVTRDAEKLIKVAYQGACIRKFGHVVAAPEHAPVRLYLTFEKPAPKQRPAWCPKVLWAALIVPFTVKPDVDNLAKTVLDALNGVAWADDAQVVELHCVKEARKRGGEQRTTVIVEWRSL